MKIPNINEIPKEERDKRNEKCRACDTRKWYARRLDFHFDWWDCPYNCPNDYEHLMRKMDEAVTVTGGYCNRNLCKTNELNGIGCDECEIAKYHNLEDDDSPCLNCEEGNDADQTL